MLEIFVELGGLIAMLSALYGALAGVCWMIERRAETRRVKAVIRRSKSWNLDYWE